MLKIKNGVTCLDAPFECLIHKGKIHLDTAGKETKTIDAQGYMVIPGLVDMHVHFRDPWEHKDIAPGETIISGIDAAVNGGVTSCACMPNTDPPIDSAETVEYVADKAEEYGKTKVYPVAAITKGRLGKELVDFSELLKKGAVAFSDDGSTLMDPKLMERTLQASKSEGFAVITHSLDETGSEGWVLNKGKASEAFGTQGISNKAEYSIVERDIKLAQETGGRLHVAHVSTRESVLMIQQAKEEGIDITCEATPHHLVLSEDDITGPDPNYKMSPPLRSKQDREALIEGLKNGVIDVIASDHAPHPQELKQDLDTAACGITGIETMLFLVLQEIVFPGILPMDKALDAMSCNPAHILGIEEGTLDQGCAADIVIIDPEHEWKCSEDFFRSQSRNTPFIGRSMRGRISHIFIQGKKAALDG